MTEIQKNPLPALKSRHDGLKTEHTLDDYRSALETVQNKLRVSEIEVERERNRANEHLEKTQNITAGIFALIEPEILHAFTSMIEESIETITNTGAFERAVESQIEYAFDNSSFLNADDVDERIGDAFGGSLFDSCVDERIGEAFGDSHFETCVRDVVKKMVDEAIGNVDKRIGDAIGDIDWTSDQITSSFDTAVRDAVREMINDGDISISVENIELSVDM